jgi:hypothetical protein
MDTTDPKLIHIARETPPEVAEWAKDRLSCSEVQQQPLLREGIERIVTDPRMNKVWPTVKQRCKRVATKRDTAALGEADEAKIQKDSKRLLIGFAHKASMLRTEWEKLPKINAAERDSYLVNIGGKAKELELLLLEHKQISWQLLNTPMMLTLALHASPATADSDAFRNLLFSPRVHGICPSMPAVLNALSDATNGLRRVNPRLDKETRDALPISRLMTNLSVQDVVKPPYVGVENAEKIYCVRSLAEFMLYYFRRPLHGIVAEMVIPSCNQRSIETPRHTL